MQHNDNFYPFKTFIAATKQGGRVGSQLSVGPAILWGVGYVLIYGFLAGDFEIDGGLAFGLVVLGLIPTSLIGTGIGTVVAGLSALSPTMVEVKSIRSIISAYLVLAILMLVFPLVRPVLESDIWYRFPLLPFCLFVHVIFLAKGAMWLSGELPDLIAKATPTETPVGERPVEYSTVWLRLLRKFQGRTF